MMIRKYRVLSLMLSLSLLSLVACGGENIGFTSDAVQSTGGQTGSGGAFAATGGGGAAASAGGSNGGASASIFSFKRAGYGGYTESQTGIVGPDQRPTSRESELHACDGAARSYYDRESCTAGTLCSPGCTEDADCPTLGSAVSRCEACDPSGAIGNLCFSDAPSCVLGCASDADCPSDMGCLPDTTGRTVCMFSDVPWAPGCEGYCARGEDKCGEGAPCCDGLTCSPWGTCEDRTCVDFAWECGEGLPPCCDPFSCIDGFCQSTP